jgi:hypothetical protein
MSLKQWADNGWLRPHKTSPKEIKDLLGIVKRDVADADGKISADWRFGIAYNAALKLCGILIAASGYRPEKALQHFRTIAALPLILGDAYKNDAAYLDACRMKRNTVEYDTAGAATDRDAKELIEFVGRLQPVVMDWLKKNHPDLLK